MKKIMKILICVLLALATFMEVDGVSVQAAGKAETKKAIKAYQKYLAKDSIEWNAGKYDNAYKYDSEDFEFSMADVNKDGVPEMFLKCKVAAHYEGYESVYCYYKNKVKWVGGLDKVKSYYPKSGIVELYYFGMGDTAQYFKIEKGGKSKVIGAAYFAKYSPEDPIYRWKNKDVTVSEFKSLLKKEAGNKKVTVKKKDWHENTAYNRANMSKLVKW